MVLDSRSLTFAKTLGTEKEGYMPNQLKAAAVARILIVEDELMLAGDLVRSLESLGYEIVATVSSVKEAIRIIEASKPDLILADIKLQGHGDGIEIVERIHGRFDIPVIYLTDFTDTDLLERAKKTEPYGYLRKPPTPDELRFTIETVLYKNEADKKVEEALQSREAKFRFLAEHATDILWTMDLALRTTYISPSVERLLGFTPEEYMRLPIEEQITQESLAIAQGTLVGELRKEAEGVLEPDRYTILEVDCVHKNGSIVCLEAMTRLIRDENGVPIGIHGLSRDVTERKKEAEALRESDQKYRVMVENSRDLIFSFKPRGEFVYLSPSAESVLGYKPEKLMGRPAQSLIHPEDLPALQGALQDDIGGGHGARSIEYRIRHASGEWRWHLVRGNAVRNERGEFIYYTGITRDVTERRQAEQALKMSLHRLDQIIEFLPDPTFVIDDKGHVEGWNQAIVELTGVPAESIIGKGNYEYALPFYGERRPVLADLALNWDESYLQKYISVSRREDGVLVSQSYHPALNQGIYLYATARVLYDDAGRPVGAIESLRDISEMKLAEKALKDGERRLAQIIEFLPDATLVIDNQGRLVAWNRAMIELTGVDASAVVGKGDYEYALPFYGQRRPVMIDLVIDYDETVASQYSSIRREGDRLISETCVPNFRGRGPTWLWNVAAPLYDRDGRVVGAIEAIRDITAVKRSEEVLRENEERYRTLFERATDAILVVRAEGRIIDANPAALELLGTTREQAINADIADFYYNRSDRDRFRDEVDRNGFVHGFSWSIRRKDGSPRLGEMNSAAWKDSEGNLIAYLSMIRDITETRALEEQLRQAQKMEALGTLTGGIAHDFNNLLTIINGYTELLVTEKTEDDPDYNDLQKILETGRNGAELVRRLLALARKGESSPEPLCLNSAVLNSVALMERAFPKMIEIETDLSEPLGMVNADSAQVEQVLMNIGINAKEAMPQGGRLRIETKIALMDEGYCRLHPGSKPGPHVVIEISDTGKGMNRDMLERIFDPFFTTKGWDFKKGTGLGLSVAKGIVEQHGGTITCESEPGKGTTFRVIFPVIEALPTAGKTELRAETVPGMKKILLVDDEEFVRNLGKRILERAGYQVVVAADGKDALDIYESEPSAIALVVLDLIMPRMGGEQCLDQLLKVNPQLKAVISTGHSLAPKERERLSRHARGFIMKPYQIEQLVETVRTAVNGD